MDSVETEEQTDLAAVRAVVEVKALAENEKQIRLEAEEAKVEALVEAGKASGVEAEGEIEIEAVGNIWKKDDRRSQLDEGTDENSERKLPGYELDLKALKELWGSMAAVWDNPVVRKENPGTLTKLNRFVSATGKVVDGAPINPGRLAGGSLVRVLDVATSSPEVTPVMIREEICEVGEEATTCVCSGSNYTADVKISDNQDTGEAADEANGESIQANYWVSSGKNTDSEETVSDDEVVLEDHEAYKTRGVPLSQGSPEEGAGNQKPGCRKDEEKAKLATGAGNVKGDDKGIPTCWKLPRSELNPGESFEVLPGEPKWAKVIFS